MISDEEILRMKMRSLPPKLEELAWQDLNESTSARVLGGGLLMKYRPTLGTLGQPHTNVDAQVKEVLWT